MFDRLMNVIKGMFSKGISKLETPELMAEQAQADLEGNVKKLREAVTDSLAGEKMLEKQLQKNAEELATWHQRATVAVQQNNDEIARQCLKKKEEHNQAGMDLESQSRQQKTTTVQLKERLAEMEQKLREFKNKKQDLVTRTQASNATAKANELLSNSAGGTSGMDKWEQKIREKEARSEAMREMSESDSVKQVDIQLLDVDSQLAALKEQMSAGAPKLIVDTQKDKKSDSE